MVALGFMLLIAFSSGELLRRAGLPALLGYILTGIVLGPGIVGLVEVDLPWTIITDEVMADMRLVNVLVIGVIGMLAGGKFRARDMAGDWRLVVLITLAMLVTVVPLTMAGVLVAAQLFPGSLVFLAEQPFMEQLVIASLFGILAFGLSPSTTVAMIQELRARGQLSTTILGVVLLGGVVLFSLFSIVLSLARHVIGPEALTLGTVVELIPFVFLDLIIALLLGVIAGVAAVLYLRYVKRENLLFTLGLILLAYYVSFQLEVEPLLVFLAAGVFVQNASEQGEVMLKALEKIGLPVFIVYFATVAAGLDLVVAFSYLPLVIALMSARGLGLWAATHWGARRLTEKSHVYDGLWGTFIAQDAVVLVLAGVVAIHFPEWGASFQNVVMTTVIVYLVVGPVWLKFGLDRAGETHWAREQAVQELDYRPEEIDELFEIAQAEHMPHPDIEDAWLRGRIEDLREELLELDDEFIRQPLQRQQDVIQSFLDEFAVLVEESLAGIEERLGVDEDGAIDAKEMRERVKDIQKRFFARLHPLYEPLMAEPPIAVDREAMEAMLGAVRMMEESRSLYKVERERELFEPDPDDHRAVRALKIVRRLRYSIWGPGYRSVPLGRLWRYYMELALPVRFARTVPQISSQNEIFWRELWRQIRSVERFFDELLRAVERTYVVDAIDEDEEPLSQVQLKQARAAELVAEFSTAHDRRRDELVELLSRRINVGLLGYGATIGRCYRTFVQAASRAGTLELPSFRYRPSSRYDQARRAEARMRERLSRHQHIVTGYRGWIRLDQELVLLGQWFDLYKSRLVRNISTHLDGRSESELADLKARCRDLLTRHQSGEHVDWPEAYEQGLRPLIHEHRRRLESSMSMLHQGVITRTLMDLLEARVARLPQDIELLSQEPDRAVVPLGTLYRLPLRHWVITQLTRDIALRFVELNERGTAILGERILAWASIEQVLEFNLSKARPEHTIDAELSAEDPLASVSGLERALKLIEQLDERRKKEVDTVLIWLRKEVDRSVQAAVLPLTERRIGEIQRELARRDAASLVARGESWAAELLRPLTTRVGTLRRGLSSISSEIVADLRSLLVEEAPTLDRSDIREILHAREPAVFSRAPVIYRRLFTPIPLDIPDFYLHRPGVEASCLKLIGEWFEGTPHALLLTGDAGIGKRTLVHHLVPTRVYSVYSALGDEEFQTIRLPDHIRGEEEICERLSILLGDGEERPSDLAEFAERLVETVSSRRIVIIENGSKIFSRTADGLEMARRFLRLISATSGHTLWVVVLNTPAATYLQTTIGLYDYFTLVCELEGLKSDELERLIMARHQVSGYSIEFTAAELRRLERMRRPFVSADAMRQPRREFFTSLAEKTHGNPRQALLYWLRAVRPSESDEAHVIVESDEKHDYSLLEGLTLTKKLLLGLLAQHYCLTAEELHLMLRLPTEEVRIELQQLMSLGFVESLPEMVESYKLRALAEPLVNRELRQSNLI
ncbi:MAG: cation:proton antiporter [Bradymonadaceae bacterium]